MASRRVYHRLLLMVLLTALLALQQAVSADGQEAAAGEQTPTAGDQSPAVQQLWDLLGQTVGDTVVKALADYHRQHQLQQQQQQQQQQQLLQQQQQPSDAGNITDQPACQRHPEPLPEGLPAEHVVFDATDIACARSCLQLRDQGGAPQDGIYWFTGMPVPVLCDFSHDGGGWTLLLTSDSKTWDLLSAKSRREGSPTLTDDYSILRYADAIRDLGTGGRFAYRIEAQAETGRRRWGGVWLAPRHYSFVDETGSQTGVRLVRRFDKWTYKDTGIEQRMPWLRVEGGDTTVLTTSDVHGIHWWGTLASHSNTPHDYHHSPWIHEVMRDSGRVLYWMREEEL